jgi:hypothetical protein
MISSTALLSQELLSHQMLSANCVLKWFKLIQALVCGSNIYINLRASLMKELFVIAHPLFL